MFSKFITAMVLSGLLMASSSASPTAQPHFTPSTPASPLVARQEGFVCPPNTIGGTWYADPNCTDQSKETALACFKLSAGCVSLRTIGFRAIFTPTWPGCKWYWYPNGCEAGGRKEVLDTFGGFQNKCLVTEGPSFGYSIEC